MAEPTSSVTDNMLDRSNRRSLKWVEPDFQRRYAILLVSIVLLVSAALIGIFYFYSFKVLGTLLHAGVKEQHPLYGLVANQMKGVLFSIGVVVVLFAIFILIMANFLSHRIVGPIYAIKRSLESIGKRDFEAAQLTLRTDDEFRDIAELINEVVEKKQTKNN